MLLSLCALDRDDAEVGVFGAYCLPVFLSAGIVPSLRGIHVDELVTMGARVRLGAPMPLVTGRASCEL